MKTLWNTLAVGAGGAVGAIFRYLLGFLPLKPENGFPVVTLCVNAVGAFCIGLIAALAGKQPEISPRLLLLLKVGFCGGFTTFSTFSLEALDLMQSGKSMLAFVYVLLSVTICVSAVFGAQALVK